VHAQKSRKVFWDKTFDYKVYYNQSPILSTLSIEGSAGSILDSNLDYPNLASTSIALSLVYYVATIYYVLCTMHYVLCTMHCVLCTYVPMHYAGGGAVMELTLSINTCTFSIPPS
jgi:hypothetical protein